MTDLFDWSAPAKYPARPGFKERTTSKDAAARIAPRAPTLRDLVLTALKDVWPAGLTPDECADAIGATVLAIRPRLSELKKMGLVLETTVKRPNISGVPARVLVARKPA